MKTPQPGDILRDDVGDIRVMAVAEGYAMCRRPGCYPFVAWLADLSDMERELATAVTNSVTAHDEPGGAS